MATPISATRLPRRLPRPGKGAEQQPVPSAPGSARVVTSSRKRTRPYLVMGAVLAVFGALAFALGLSRVGGRVPVLQLAHPVKAGQTIAASDLVSTSVAAGSGVPLIPTADSGSVVGHQVALSLPGGTLLSRADFGAVQVAAPGQAVVAVSVKAGAFPTELATGATVAVAAVTQPAAGTASGPQVVVASLPTATVLSTTVASDSSGAMSVSLLADAGAAGQIASIPAGAVQLIVLGGDA